MKTLHRFEKQGERLLAGKDFAKRIAIFVAYGIVTEVATMSIGALGFHYVEHLGWLNSALNAAMVITGNGPAFEPKTDGGKVFQIIFSLSGVVIFGLVISVMLAPVFHRILHHFHVSPPDENGKALRHKR